MPLDRKLLGAAAFSLALAGGGVAGALLGTPSLSGAQDDDTTETTSDATGDALHGGRHRGEHLATAAEALGITEDELRTALQDGQSIAQVAEAEGVDVQVVIDALVAAATERLEEMEAALPERMADLVEREDLGDRLGARHRLHHLAEASLDVAADAIGISEDELRTALREGATVADVAEANDVEVQSVIDALVAAAEARIDEAVSDGDLEEARAAELREGLEDRITARVNGEGGFGGPRHHGFPGDGPEPTDDAG